MAQGDDILLNIAMKIKADDAAVKAEGARVGSLFFRSLNQQGVYVTPQESMKLANEAIAAKQKKEAGGIFGDLKASAIGGGVAGAAAAGVLMLVDALKSAAKESKILSTVTGEFYKAMGLLMDLILLPFLPLLVGALVALYGAVVWFGKLWEEFWKKPETPEDAVKKTAQVSAITIPGMDSFLKVLDAWKRFLEWLDSKTGWLSAVLKMFTDWWEGAKKQWDILLTYWDDFKKKLNLEAFLKWCSDVRDNFAGWIEGVGKQWDILVMTLSNFWENLKGGIIGFINSILALWNSNPALKAIKNFDLIENTPGLTPHGWRNTNTYPDKITDNSSPASTTAPSTVTVNIKGDVYTPEQAAERMRDTFSRYVLPFLPG